MSAPHRFVIVGLPRSGTTWLQTLLNSDPRILCRGEPFDAWQIDDRGSKQRDLPSLIARDVDPGAFFDRFMAPGTGHEAVGFKILFQHHPRLLQSVLPARPDVTVIHVTRKNRLAQFASQRLAEMTGRWTQTGKAPPQEKLAVDPRWAAEMCNELETRDFLLGRFLESLANPRLVLRYGDLHSAASGETVRTALGLHGGPPLASGLVKQGANRIEERFADPAPLRAYFEGTGRAGWLGPEL